MYTVETGLRGTDGTKAASRMMVLEDCVNARGTKQHT